MNQNADSEPNLIAKHWGSLILLWLKGNKSLQVVSKTVEFRNVLMPVVLELDNQKPHVRLIKFWAAMKCIWNIFPFSTAPPFAQPTSQL